MSGTEQTFHLWLHLHGQWSSVGTGTEDEMLAAERAFRLARAATTGTPVATEVSFDEPTGVTPVHAPDPVVEAARHAASASEKAGEAAGTIDEYDQSTYAVAVAVLAVAEQLHALRLAVVDEMSQLRRTVS